MTLITYGKIRRNAVSRSLSGGEVSMKCEVCQINDASKAIRRNVDGSTKELFVCESCARTAPHPGSTPASLTDVLFSLGMQMGGQDRIEDNVCPGCGMSRNDIRAKHRLGCPKCYEIFLTDIRTFLSEQQPVAFHAGRGKNDDSARQEIDRLKQDLEKAVADERFEDAAVICEKIRVVNSSNESDGKNG